MGKKIEKKITKNVVANIVNKIDPMGLFAYGCPEDEYESEINDINQILTTIPSNELSNMKESQFIKLVVDIFRKWFNGLTINETDKEYVEMGKQLFKSINQIN